MRVLLLSGYDAPSHQRWRRGLEQRFEQWEWTQLSLPPRHFKWRMRGNGFIWAHSERATLQRDYDLLIATSMVDLVTLRGLMPELARLPTWVYFHENQFAYPTRDGQRANVEPQLVNFYTALCADAIAFNSEYNRTSFLRGVELLLRRLPDTAPEGVLPQLRARSRVLPVAIEPECFCPSTSDTQPFTLIWNHRWEYDKGPDRLLLALQNFFEQRVPDSPPVRVHVVGQQFRQQPEAFAALHELLREQDALGQWGYVDSRAQYRVLLSQSHLVLSTALHDFQGLSVLEGVAAGARPLVPEREAYPEWFEPHYCYASHRDNPEREARALAEQLVHWADRHRRKEMPPPPSVAFLSDRQLDPLYRDCLTGMASRRT